MKPRTSARVRRDDEGSALVLALMVVLLVGSLFAAAIDYTKTGLLITPKVRNDRNEVLTIQSAVDGAINNIRGSSTTGKTTTSICPEFVPPQPTGLPGVEATEDFRVTCTPQPPGGTPTDAAPAFAIHALGSAPDGVRQVNPSNAELLVTGGIYSRGVITVGGGSRSVMSVTGSAVSETTGGCSSAPQLTTTDLTGPRCGPSHALGDGADPGYGPGIVNQSALDVLIASGSATEGADPVPTCSGGTAQFAAGYYGERPDVLLSKTHPSCSASVWRFAPGLYYFDYDGVWNLGGARVVFGTPTTSTTLGTACNRTAPGAHLVFGGDSRIFTQSSASADSGLEVCGPVDTSYYSGPGTPQRIAVYGLTSANSLGTSSAGSSTSLAANVVGTGGWDDPAKALIPTDGASAAVVLQKNSAATLAWTGFGSAPKGVRVTRVTAELTHLGANVKAASLRFTGPGGVNTSENVAGCSVCSFDITTVLENRRTDVLWRYLSQLTATYEVQGQNDQLEPAAASLVDGIRLVVEYATPALTAQTCPSSGCLFVESANNANVFVHGTVYTPSSAWSVSVHNAGETIFDRGVVLRDLAVNVSGSTKQSSSPFQLPPPASGGRKVLFRGYVDSVERVRACVRYVDGAPLPGTADTQSFSGYSIDVTQWLVFDQGEASAPVTCP